MDSLESILRSAPVLKQEAGEYIAECVMKHQTLDKKERAAWRDIQKMQSQADVKLQRSKQMQKRKGDQMRSRWRKHKQKRKRGRMKSRSRWLKVADDKELALAPSQH